jgi:tetratricopeptide (TPR) repeat protein
MVFWICLCAWFGLARLKKIRESKEQSLPTLTPALQEVIQPSDALKKARQRVAENPDDPAAHLDLAVLLIEVQQYGEAPQEFARVENLIGDDGFYVDHGQMYHSEQKWIACTWAFLHAYELKPDIKGGELFGLWHEAVYKAFNNPDARLVIDLDRIQALDAPIAGVARAEVELVTGNVGRAEAIIAEVLVQNPNFIEALLVQARVFAKQKNVDRIGKILDGLKRIPDLSPWIRDEIGRIESIEIP